MSRNIRENLKRLVEVGDHSDWGYFEEKLHEYVDCSVEISLETIDTWMVNYIPCLIIDYYFLIVQQVLGMAMSQVTALITFVLHLTWKFLYIIPLFKLFKRIKLKLYLTKHMCLLGKGTLQLSVHSKHIK